MHSNERRYVVTCCVSGSLEAPMVNTFIKNELLPVCVFSNIDMKTGLKHAHCNNTSGCKWNHPLLDAWWPLGQRLPCREVGHKQLWNQLLQGDGLVRVLRTHDVLLLHSSQHTVLHVKVMNPVSTCPFVSHLADGAAYDLRTRRPARWGAEWTRGVLLHEEAAVALAGSQSCEEGHTDTRRVLEGWKHSRRCSHSQTHRQVSERFRLNNGS